MSSDFTVCLFLERESCIRPALEVEMGPVRDYRGSYSTCIRPDDGKMEKLSLFCSHLLRGGTRDGGENQEKLFFMSFFLLWQPEFSWAVTPRLSHLGSM